MTTRRLSELGAAMALAMAVGGLVVLVQWLSQ
jgi:hypothetical protein